MGTTPTTPGGPGSPIASPVAGSLGASSSGLEVCVVCGTGSHRDKWEKNRTETIQVGGESQEVEFVACDHHTDDEFNQAVDTAMDHLNRGVMPPTIQSAFSPQPHNQVPGGLPSASVPSVVPPPVESNPPTGTPMRPLRSSNLADLVKRVGGDPSKAGETSTTSIGGVRPAPSTEGAPSNLTDAVNRVVGAPTPNTQPGQGAAKVTDSTTAPTPATPIANPPKPATTAAPTAPASPAATAPSATSSTPKGVVTDTVPAARATTGGGTASPTTTQADTAKVTDANKPASGSGSTGSSGPSGAGQK